MARYLQVLRRRDRASPTGIAGRIGQRVVAWVRQSRHPAVAGIHAIDIIQPPGIVIPPIADMDAHQMIATAALTAKSSAEKPKKARFSDAKADLLDALMRVLDADFDALPAPRQEALMAESMELRYGLPRCLKQSDRLTNTM